MIGLHSPTRDTWQTTRAAARRVRVRGAWLAPLVGVAVAFSISTNDASAQATTSSPNAHPDAAAITLSGEIKLDQLVELVSTRLNVSVEYTQRDLAQRSVTLRLRHTLDDQELWRTLTLVLEGQGFAIVPMQDSRILRIVPVAQAPSEAQSLTDPNDLGRPLAEPGSNFVTVLIELQTASPSTIAAALQPLLTPNAGQVKPIGEAGLLLISDFRGRVQRALDVIERLDSPTDPIDRVTIELQASTASRVIESVQLVLTAELTADPSLAQTASGAVAPGVQLLPMPDDRSILILAPASRLPRITSLIKRFDVAEPIITRAYHTGGAPIEELAESIGALLQARSSTGNDPITSTRLITDRLTSTIYATATETQHTQIAALIEQILESPAGAGSSLLAIEIRNRDAAKLAETLRELLDLSASADSTDDDSASDAPAPGGENVPSAPVQSDGDSGLLSGVNEQVTISVDESTNSILVVGNPLTLAQVESIIERLDRRQPQVMIELTLVSLDEGEALDFGVELTTQFTSGQTSIDLSSLFGLGVGSAIAAGTGFTGSVIRPGDFDVLVRALEAVSSGRSVSSPKTLINNNATATVRGISREPFTSINASNTVATTSLGGFEDAGTTVTVTPHITAGDHLSLEYSVELSAFTGEPIAIDGGGVLPPPSQQNSFDGEVTIPDGFAVVLGGLETRRTGESVSRIPILGEIPLLGLLFRTTSQSETVSRFYIVIKATVLRDPGFEDLKLLGERNLVSAELDDGFPTLQPIWLD